jgi:chromosome segregation ATPase
MFTRSPILTGLLHPLNLLLLALSVLAGLISAWWLFPVGLLFWLVMVVTVARNPSLRIAHQMQSREPLAQRFQKRFDRLERSQVSIFNSLASAPRRVQRALQPVQDEMQRLIDEAYALCRRMTTLENYRIVRQSQADLETELRDLNDIIERSEDARTRREYEESRRALQRRAEKLKMVSTQLDRVEAQLVSLSNEMEGLMTEVVRLQAAGAEGADQRVPVLVEMLREQTAQLRQFEREAVEV